jgi:anthranilate phosphoribosyltransferase
MRDILETLARGEDLAPDMAAFAFNSILDGNGTEAEIASLLMGLRQKGETVVELSAAVTAMRARMTHATVNGFPIDVCGTGGDGAHTLNISTAVAIVVAATGFSVAKHGNKAASSQTGATDVLSALGVNTSAPQHIVEACVNDIGIGYFAAPLYHPALVRLAPMRKKLGVRTLFNLIGPLCNPAGVIRQLVGVTEIKLIDMFIDVLRATGSEAATVVCGADNIDEFSLAGINHYQDFSMATKTPLRRITSATIGLMTAPLASIKGGAPETNASALLDLLNGAKGAYRDIVLMNAAFAMMIAQPEGGGPQDFIGLAEESIDSGCASALLQKWIKMSNQS